jgi:hypothetical protein
MRRVSAIAAVLVAVLAAGPVPAAVRYDASNTGAVSSPVSLLVGAGADRYLLVTVALPDSTARVDGVDLDGTPLHRLSTASAGPSCILDLWGMAAPASGTHRVNVRATPAAVVALVVATAYDGVDRTGPPAPGAVTGAGANLGASSSLPPGGLMAASACAVSGSGSGSPSFVNDPGQTFRTGSSVAAMAVTTADKSGTPQVAVAWRLTGTPPYTWMVSPVALPPPPLPDAASPRDGPAPVDTAPIDTSVPNDSSVPADAAAPAPVDGDAATDAPVDVPAPADGALRDLTPPAGADARAVDLRVITSCSCNVPGRPPRSPVLAPLLLTLVPLVRRLARVRAWTTIPSRACGRSCAPSSPSATGASSTTPRT